MPQTSATAVPALCTSCPRVPALPAALSAERLRVHYRQGNAQPFIKAPSIPVCLGTELCLLGHRDL